MPLSNNVPKVTEEHRHFIFNNIHVKPEILAQQLGLFRQQVSTIKHSFRRRMNVSALTSVAIEGIQVGWNASKEIATTTVTNTVNSAWEGTSKLTSQVAATGTCTLLSLLLYTMTIKLIDICQLPHTPSFPRSTAHRSRGMLCICLILLYSMVT